MQPRSGCNYNNSPLLFLFVPWELQQFPVIVLTRPLGTIRPVCRVLRIQTRHSSAMPFTYVIVIAPKSLDYLSLNCFVLLCVVEAISLFLRNLSHVFTYYDVIKWKHFPRYWPFVRGIHWSPRIPLTKVLMFSLICALNKRLSKQSWGWWFDTPSCSLLRHCDVCVISSLAHDL